MFRKKKKNSNGKNNNSLVARIVPRFVKNPLLQRWVILVSISLALAFILSPRITHIRPPDYAVGSIATKDIKADRNFLVEDRAVTEQKRLEAVNKVQSIFDYDRNMPAKIGMRLSKAFLIMENAYALIEKEDLTSQEKDLIINDARKQFEAILGTTLTGSEFKSFNKNQFSFTILNKIVKLAYSAYNKGPFMNEPLSNRNIEKGIIIHDIISREVVEHKNPSSILTLNDIEKLLSENSEKIFDTSEKELRNISVSLMKKVMRSNLTFSRDATEASKIVAAENVKPVLYEVQKNEMIVREGQKVTPSDLYKLEALFRGQEGKGFVYGSRLIGMVLIVLFLFIILYYVVKNWLRTLKDINIDLFFLGTAAILQVLLVKASIFICEAVSIALPSIPTFISLYAIPFTAGTMLVTVLINRDAGLIFSVFLSLLLTFLVDEKIPFLFFSFIGSIFAAYTIANCRQRSAFYKTGLLIGGVNMVLVICLSLLAGTLVSMDTLFKLVMGFFGGIIAGVIVSGIVPLFESLFRYTTDIKLLELANLNQPVFQQMIMVAPGTYHHSIVVASMVEAAAEAIGASSLLAKVSAYYHDMGKMRKPQYYIENQKKWENRHDKLTPKMSSLVIISHVKDGWELAKEYKLGRAISDIIQQHHGTRLAVYFYEKAKKEKNPSSTQVLESDYRYPGPKPQTKEAGLVLLGDVIEASSRTLKDPTPSRIKTLVDKRIREVIDDGQLDESELTFSDINKIAESFTMILNGIFHQRIEYFESSAEEETEKEDVDPHKKPAKESKNRSSESTKSASKDS
jgi:putative nucleotidyltransferase with HDIG domain